PEPDGIARAAGRALPAEGIQLPSVAQTVHTKRVMRRATSSVAASHHQNRGAPLLVITAPEDLSEAHIVVHLSFLPFFQQDDCASADGNSAAGAGCPWAVAADATAGRLL